jgi:hypothetical protein
MLYHICIILVSQRQDSRTFPRVTLGGKFLNNFKQHNFLGKQPLHTKLIRRMGGVEEGVGN